MSLSDFDFLIGSAAVLGLPQPVCYQVTENGIPLEQAVSRQRLRPGSGLLAVRINMDGPTRVLTVWDIKVSEERRFAKPDEREWVSISKHQHPQLQLDLERNEEEEKNEELQVVYIQKSKNKKTLTLSIYFS